MADSILTRRTKVDTNYQLIASHTVSGSATTQVDFTGLNIVKGEEILIVFDVVNAIASDNSISIFFNGNYTATNYYNQEIKGDGAAITASRGNNAYVGGVSNGNKTLMYVNVALQNSGYITAMGDNTRNYGTPTALQWMNRYVSSTFTATSITSIRLLMSGTNGIGIGSNIEIYKVGL